MCGGMPGDRDWLSAELPFHDSRYISSIPRHMFLYLPFRVPRKSAKSPKKKSIFYPFVVNYCFFAGDTMSRVTQTGLKPSVSLRPSFNSSFACLDLSGAGTADMYCHA